MMEDILKKRMKNSLGKIAKITLINNFIYKGPITGYDENQVEILDIKTNTHHIFKFNNIKDCEVEQ